MNKRLRNLTIGLALGGFLVTGAVAPRPASADTTSTVAIGAAALIGGLILYNNYQHKQQAANDVVGYTRNGGSILGDGRIVMPNGQTFTPNANGQYANGQYAYYNQRFQPTNAVYDYNRSGTYDQTHRHDTARQHAWNRNSQAEMNQIARDHNRAQYDRHDHRN